LNAQSDFDERERAAVYRVIASRRDIREFSSGELDDDVLERILAAAHRAPSVGFSQPWGFVIVRDRTTRKRVASRGNVGSATSPTSSRASWNPR
jgi:nitroreductase